jgi:hypothetical protein
MVRSSESTATLKSPSRSATSKGGTAAFEGLSNHGVVTHLDAKRISNSDQMGYDWCALGVPAHLILQHPIGICSSLMLTQMFQP